MPLLSPTFRFHQIAGSAIFITAMGLWAGPAFAQKSSSDIEYVYDAEFLDGSLLEGDGPRLVVRGGAARTLLIRPRLHYLPELLKSVETL